MRLTCFVVVTLCSLVLADVNLEGLPTGDKVFGNVGPLDLELRAVGNDNALVTDDPELLVGVLGRGAIADAILNAFEELRQIIINTMDPLEISKAGPAIFTVSTGTRVSATIYNLRAEGLRWFIVDDITVSALRLTLGAHVTLPWLIVTGRYDVDARVAVLITHNAGGNFRLFANRFECGINLKMGTDLGNGHLVLRELDVKLHLNDLNIQVDGMTGSDYINSYINYYIRNLTQDFIQNRMDEISETVSTAIFDTVNDFLKQFTINDLIV